MRAGLALPGPVALVPGSTCLAPPLGSALASFFGADFDYVFASGAFLAGSLASLAGA